MIIANTKCWLRIVSINAISLSYYTFHYVQDINKNCECGKSTYSLHYCLVCYQFQTFYLFSAYTENIAFQTIIIDNLSIYYRCIFLFLSIIIAQNSTSSSSKPPAAFVKSFEKLVKEAHNLTQSYQNEIGKWKAHQYDNKTMISVTSNYLPKYENLVNESKTLQPPKQYQNATDIYKES